MVAQQILDHCYGLYSSSSYAALHDCLLQNQSSLTDYPDYWVLLGLSRKSLNYPIEQVIYAYSQDFSLDKTRHDIHFNLANSYSSFNFELSCYYYKSAIALNPFESSYWYNFYLLLHDAPDNHLISTLDAHTSIKNAIILDPFNSNYLLDYAIRLSLKKIYFSMLLVSLINIT